MRRLLLLGAAVLSLTACGKSAPEPAAVAAATAAGPNADPDDSGRIASWKIAYVCPDGTNVDLLSDGKYGEWVDPPNSIDKRGHWTELADGLQPSQGCPPAKDAANDVRSYDDANA